MITLALFIGAAVVVFVYLTGIYNEIYWKKRNVAFYSKNKVTGPLWGYLTNQKAIFESLCDVYETYRNEPAVGLGAFLTPTLYVKDPKNVQHVLVTDFSSFNHRGIDVSQNDVLGDNILFMNGSRWKLVRHKMSPLFTTAKLKSMFYIIDRSAKDFVEHLKNNKVLLKGGAFDTICSFCSCAIGAAVFGMTTKSIFDSPFLVMSQNAFKPTFSATIRYVGSYLCNPLFNFFGIKFFGEYEDFMIGAVKKVIASRREDNAKRHDFADVCVQLQSMGKMVDSETGLEIEPTDELLAAQAFFFFTAGVEPVAIVIYNTLVELGRNPKYLELVQDEIDDSFRTHGEMNYESIMNMKVLDMVMNESMRLHPPVGFVTRRCIKDTVLPVGNIKVDKGTTIYVPIYELHHDERYYSEPYVFDPERFSPENKHNIHDITYLPFGRGNRVCLGARYGFIQAKAGLVHLLRHFIVKTTVLEEGFKYSRQQFQVKLKNFDIEFIPRNVTASH